MLTEYIQKALEKAQYKKLENGTWFAEIPEFEGVWANADNVEKCRHELKEVLEEWLILKIRDQDTIPKIEGAEIKIKEVATASFSVSGFPIPSKRSGGCSSHDPASVFYPGLI
jgi:predicted RNase H-like HicB family nuclease